MLHFTSDLEPGRLFSVAEVPGAAAFDYVFKLLMITASQVTHEYILPVKDLNDPDIYIMGGFLQMSLPLSAYIPRGNHLSLM